MRAQASLVQQEIHDLNVALSSQVDRFLRPELRGKGLLQEIVMDEETRISDEDRLLAPSLCSSDRVSRKEVPPCSYIERPCLHIGMPEA